MFSFIKLLQAPSLLLITIFINVEANKIENKYDNKLTLFFRASTQTKKQQNNNYKSNKTIPPPADWGLDAFDAFDAFKLSCALWRWVLYNALFGSSSTA